jgi:hypothetical protein
MNGSRIPQLSHKSPSRTRDEYDIHRHHDHVSSYGTTVLPHRTTTETMPHRTAIETGLPHSTAAETVQLTETRNTNTQTLLLKGPPSANAQTQARCLPQVMR